MEDGIFLPWCSSFPFTNLRTYIISYALKSELWIRLSGNGRKHFTSSFICNGISDRPAPAFQSIRTWSKLQSCSFVLSKILKTDSNSWSTRTEPESLKTTFHVLQDHGWFLGSVLCRTITFSLVKQQIKPSVITGKSSKWLWTTWWRPQRCRHQVWEIKKTSSAHASLGYKLNY